MMHHLKRCLIVPLLAAFLPLVTLPAAVTGQYIHLENPTGPVMEWTEFQVMKGGANLVAKHREMFSGVPASEARPFASNQGQHLCDGNVDVTKRGPTMGRWAEINLGAEQSLEQIVLHASSLGGRFYNDHGHRVLTVMDAQRRVVWARKFDYYEAKAHAHGVFTFDLIKGDEGINGTVVPAGDVEWLRMPWVMGVGAEKLPADAAARMKRFSERHSHAQVKAFADHFFRLLERDDPALAAALALHERGEHAQALEAWKRFWFARMKANNKHAAYGATDRTYGSAAQDLLEGVRVSIGSKSARATRFTPGRMLWVDLPEERGADFSNAFGDVVLLGYVNLLERPLLHAFAQTGDTAFVQRWAEMMDDWAMNYFADCNAHPAKPKDLFVMTSANSWGVMMEELDDIAQQRPDLIALIPAATLARVQLVCLNEFAPAYWVQARGTVFNHNTSGLQRWYHTLPYLHEFAPARRQEREWRQHLERWMTLGTFPDGSMVEIGDEGHLSIPMALGQIFEGLDHDKPEWFTPGWRSRAQHYYDGLYRYLFRHPAPGGFDHRYNTGLAVDRYMDLVTPFQRDADRPLPMWDASARIYAMPEVRRILDALGSVSAGRPGIPAGTKWWDQRVIEVRQKLHDGAVKILGGEKPGLPRIASDWMPYTGSYYFRGGWQREDAFVTMLAGGGDGGTGGNPFGIVRYFDHNTPLMVLQPVTIDGQSPNQQPGIARFMPGTKTGALSHAQRTPSPNRWHSSAHFDAGEATFTGVYQNVGYNYQKGMFGEPEINPRDQPISNVTSTRRVFHLRDARVFIVSDGIHFNDEAERAKAHSFRMFGAACVTTLKEGAGASFDASRQLVMDAAAKTIRTLNPDTASGAMHQVLAPPVTHGVMRDAPMDFRSYDARLSGNVGVREQGLHTSWQAAGDVAAAWVLSSADLKLEDHSTPGLASLHATLGDGSELWFASSASGAAELRCGTLAVKAEALLLHKTGGSTRGLVLGEHSAEFTLRDGKMTDPQPILRPIDPVRFSPDADVFTDDIAVAMHSDTPDVEIRYTTDGSTPTRSSALYAKPLRIAANTEFSARAYRRGTGADDFEINGTHFTEPTWAFFTQRAPLPAIAAKPAANGLRYDYLEGEWNDLFSAAHWLPAQKTGAVPREMDLSMAPADRSHALRYHGFITVPETGVYTFHAPREFVFPDTAAFYDLRLYIDGEEWSLSQWWHAHGTWSVPLARGPHRFQVDFADARTTPWKPSGMWRYYPRPWVIFQGKPGDITVNGPGFDQQRIPAAWLHHDLQ